MNLYWFAQRVSIDLRRSDFSKVVHDVYVIGVADQRDKKYLALIVVRVAEGLSGHALSAGL